MQRALWPATLGYWMDTLLAPVFDDDDRRRTRAGSSRTTSAAAARCRRSASAASPTASCRRRRSRASAGSTAPIEPGWPARPAAGLPARGCSRSCATLDADWTDDERRQRRIVGKPGDAHQTLLDIVGLHPSSVEYYSRYAESLSELFNIANLSGLGPDFWQALLALGARRPPASACSQRLGYAGAQQPDILQHFFLTRRRARSRTSIDDRPLSETSPIRAYTDDDRNYIQWLIDAASASLETLRRRAAASPATSRRETLLYLYPAARADARLLRHELPSCTRAPASSPRPSWPR